MDKGCASSPFHSFAIGSCAPGSQPRPGSIIARRTPHRPETCRTVFRGRARRNFPLRSLAPASNVRFGSQCDLCRKGTYRPTADIKPGSLQGIVKRFKLVTEDDQ